MSKLPSSFAAVVITPLLVLFLFFSETPSASAQTVTGNLLTDPGFNSGSQPLLSFLVTGTDRWHAESAALIVGPENGVSPSEPDGMLRIEEENNAASQVRQVVDISTLATDVDAGNAFATFRAEFDAPDPNVTSLASVFLIAFDGAGPAFGGASLLDSVGTGSTPLDGIVGNWETLEVGSLLSFPLPVGTRQLSVQVAYTNGTIPLNGYVDRSFLEVTIVPEPSTFALATLGLMGIGYSRRKRA